MSAEGLLDKQLLARMGSAFGDAGFLDGQRAARFAPDLPPPLVVLRAQNLSQVSLALHSANSRALPLVVRGSGSHLQLNAQDVPARGYLLLSTEQLSGVDKYSEDSLWLSAQAGTPLAEVCSRAAEIGCRPVGLNNKMSGTVGGWLARTARLPDAILGIPQPPVLAIEAVLANGTVVRSVPAPRAAVGPDLFSLFLGTGGGFGVIGSAVLKLEPMPERQLTIGYRFTELARACSFIRACLGLVIPPGELQLMVDGRAGKRTAMIWMTIAGTSSLAGQALERSRSLAEELGGAARPLDRVRAWRDEESFGKHRPLRAAVRWSQVEQLLRSADRLLGGYSFAVLDQPCLTGCRVRLRLPKSYKGDARKRWSDLVDPDGSQSRALSAARSQMAAIRYELDPEGLVNPQSWPLAWPGGGN